MDIFDKVREKSPIIKRLVEFQKTVYYPIIFGIVCILSSLNTAGIYIPLIWLLTLSVIFSALFGDDLKVFFVPFLMVYYAIGMDHEDSFVMTNGDILARFDKVGLINFVICGALMAIFLLYKLISLGALKKAFEKRGAFFWGIISLDVALLFNGAFSEMWVPMNIYYGALNALVITITYFIFLGIFRTSEDATSYLLKIMVCFGFMVFIQVVLLCGKLFATGDLFNLNEQGKIISVARNKIFLSWGVSTIIGAASVMAIPSSFYFARNNKKPIIFYIFAFVFLSVAFLINTRSALLCGLIAILISVLICCNGGANAKTNRIFTFVALGMGFIACVIMIIKLDMTAIVQNIASIFRFDIGSEGRIWLWKNGLLDFAQYPVFGVGFDHGGNADGITFSNVYSNMYHNIIIEMLGSMGIVGVIAFIIHLSDIVRVLFKGYFPNKMLIFLTPFLILSMSLFDNFFFYPNFQIIYTAFLVAMELHSENGKIKQCGI